MGGTLQCSHFFFFNDTATTEIYTLSLHDALPISRAAKGFANRHTTPPDPPPPAARGHRSGPPPPASPARSPRPVRVPSPPPPPASARAPCRARPACSVPCRHATVRCLPQTGGGGPPRATPAP